jgi:Ca2+-binding RTX toxin-like protein
MINTFAVSYSGWKFHDEHIGVDSQGNPLNISVSGLASADLNGDGRQDLIVPTITWNYLLGTEPAPILIYISTGNGLADQTSTFLPSAPKAVIVRQLVVADFNGDGRPDLFVEDTGTEKFHPFPGEQNQLFLSNSSGILIDRTDWLPQRTDFSHGSVAADFNGDGHIDLFVNNLGDDDGHPSYLLLNDGTGRFEDAGGHVDGGRFSSDFGHLWSPYWAVGVDAGSDGDVDLYWGALHSGGGDFSGWGLAENDGTGNFSLRTDAIPAWPGYPDNEAETAAVGDINHNGHEDMILYGQSPDKFQILINNGDGTFSDQSWRVEGQENGAFLPDTGGTSHFQLVDLDGDGSLDIVHHRWTPDFSSHVIYTFLNDGEGNFERLAETALPGFTPHFRVLDVNGDGIMDFASVFHDWDVPHSGSSQGLMYVGVSLGRITEPVHRIGWGTDDTIVGGDANDVLEGRGGDDVLRGGGGNDRLLGGPGNDTLYGEAGDDILRGHGGDDKLLGGAGDDRLFGGAGNDVLMGGRGDDLLRGHGGHDKLLGGAGNDRLFGGAGNDVLKGGGGNDVLRGGGGNDKLFGGGGSDVLFGDAGDDVLRGGGGDDVLNGGAGNDRLIGGAGSDRFVFAPGHGTAVIKDFEDDIDILDLTAFGFASVQEAKSFASNVAGDVVFDFAGGEQLIVENIAKAQLTSADILV